MPDEMREQVAKLGASVVKPVAPVKERGTHLTEVDKLRLHNAFLRVHFLAMQGTSIRTQMEVLRRDAAIADTAMKEAQVVLGKQRDHIEKEYGVDLSTTTVDEEGMFIPMDKAKHIPTAR